MKKLLVFITFMVFALSLSACDTEEESALNTIKSTLEGIGYEFEQRDSDAIEYYNNKAVNEEYNIDVTVVDLYIGYIDQEHWLEIIVFDSSADCDEFIENTADSGYVIYHDRDVAFITYYDQAKAAFYEQGDKDSE